MYYIVGTYVSGILSFGTVIMHIVQIMYGVCTEYVLLNL